MISLPWRCIRYASRLHVSFRQWFTTAAREDEEFRVLTLYPAQKDDKKGKAKKAVYNEVMPPREKRMQVRHNWTSVWPTAQCFRPSVVPLPLYQGYVQNKAPPGKYANAELMKIPNFLHLTPPAVKQQCAVLKKFCTQWPEELSTDDKCDVHFPLEILTVSYCHSAPTIRDERSRIVTLKVRIESLNLDYHAYDKMLKLAGKEKFDMKEKQLVLVADRCPTKKQNYDYLLYVLAALYHESQVYEAWESEMTEADMKDFFFKGSRHEKRIADVIRLLHSIKDHQEELADDTSVFPDTAKYADSLESIINQGEDEVHLQNYKAAVSKMFSIL